MKFMEPWTPINPINPNPQWPRNPAYDTISNILSPFPGPAPSVLYKEPKGKEAQAMYEYKGSIMKDKTVRDWVTHVHNDNEFRMGNANGKSNDVLEGMKWQQTVRGE